MAIKFNQVEEIKQREAGEYLMKITKAEEVTFNSGKDGIKIQFQAEDGLKIYNNFFTEGKAANNFLKLLSALGMYDGGGWENIVPFEAEDLEGLFVYVDTEKDADGRYLQCKFCGFRAYEQQPEPKPEPKKSNKAPF